MACGKVTREWFAPEGGERKQELVLYNSLIDEKVPFVPATGANSKQITWYTCGPTVYDSAHLGHARNYVTFDILRRVLEDYFGYNILFVMNVTDVDDKIILRARRNYLLKQYVAAGKTPEEVFNFAQSSLQAAQAKQAKGLKELEEQVAAAAAEGASAARRRDELEGAAKQEAHKLGQVEGALVALAALSTEGQPADKRIAAILGVAGDWVAAALDKEQGAVVTDPSIFRAHAEKYEREFFDDLEKLGCRRPDVLTRVSEYIEEIVEYVQGIINNGLAYESNGSVYFDTAKFRAHGHTYGKLKPWAVGSAALAAEGEADFTTSEKRSPTDFALWKAAKPGEPMWDSPWGKGRPGWHIECSAMASSIIGAKMDIHTGGEDLRFPHHDNELAQAEAYYHCQGCKQWVNYFLHSGHLSIEGLKMSKSLKNFITIKEALQAYTPRQLRLMFASQPWHKGIMYGEQSRTEMKAREATIKNFFQNVDAATRGIDQSATYAAWKADERELSAAILACQSAVHEALTDNLNTAGALDALSDLIKQTNLYLAKKQEPGATQLQPLLLHKAAAYVTRILACMGIVDSPADKPGLTDQAGSSAQSSAAVAGYLDAFAAFRDEVRGLAKAKAEPKEVLAACDRVRDGTLVDLGVRLEDRPDGKAVWKLDDPAVLRAEQAERAAAAAAAARKKLEAAIDRVSRDREKLAGIAALPSIPEALADKYRFNETGEPTHDKDGNELEGKAKDKARKDVEKAAKIREPLAKRLAEDPNVLDTLAAEVAALTAQLAALDTNGKQ